MILEKIQDIVANTQHGIPDPEWDPVPYVSIEPTNPMNPQPEATSAPISDRAKDLVRWAVSKVASLNVSSM